MPLTPADNVWNRAALAAGGPTPRQGDRSLADLLFVHGLVMNGGVEHLVEATSEEQMASGVQGFRFFCFDTVAELLDNVTNGRCNPEEATARYGDLLPSDDVLVRAFETVFASSPDAFDVLEGLPCAACGFLTLSEESYGSYEICVVCGWEDDGVQLANPACGGGANHLSLAEDNGVLRSRSWRPLSPREIGRAQTELAREYWANRAVVTRWECYWNGGRPLPRSFSPMAG